MKADQGARAELNGHDGGTQIAFGLSVVIGFREDDFRPGFPRAEAGEGRRGRKLEPARPIDR